MNKELKIDGRVLAAAAAATVGLLGAGFGAGWLLCRRVSERDYQERLNTEVEATRKHFYGTLAKEGLLPVEAEEHSADDHPSSHTSDNESGSGDSLGTRLEEAGEPFYPADVAEARADYGGDSLAKLEADQDPAPPTAVQNVFEGRDLNGPFEITLTEFCNIESGWMQLTLHFYAQEGIVTDDKDEPVPAYRKLCGEISREMFTGDMSEDPTIIYRRNVATGADYEIILKEESYTDAVLGGHGKPL